MLRDEELGDVEVVGLGVEDSLDELLKADFDGELYETEIFCELEPDSEAETTEICSFELEAVGLIVATKSLIADDDISCCKEDEEGRCPLPGASTAVDEVLVEREDAVELPAERPEMLVLGKTAPAMTLRACEKTLAIYPVEEGEESDLEESAVLTIRTLACVLEDDDFGRIDEDDIRTPRPGGSIDKVEDLTDD